MKKLTTIELIARFNIIHNNKFDYSSMVYNGINSKIKIICPIHGEFEQFAKNHIQGNDCFECSKIKKSKTTQDFIKNAKIIHNNYYDYSKTKYINNTIRIKIICPIHGSFLILPSDHLKKCGCKLCGIEKTKKYTLLGLDKFIEKAKNIHGNVYDYSAVEYINSYTKINIICKKHGIFSQTPQDHIHSKSGCPICNTSKGEILISNILDKYKIKYIPQKKFKGLKYKNSLIFDFYLPEYNCCIEFDGEQHFRPIECWGGEKVFEDIKNRDIIKNNYCKLNNIKLFRFSYKDDHDIIELNIKDNLNIKS